MTMGCTIVNYSAAFAVYFVCIGLLYPISALEILNKAKKITGGVGEDVEIECEVSPETAKVTWIFMGKPVLRTKYLKNNKPKNAYDDSNKTITSTITITNATVINNGNYTCIASNEDKEEKWDFNLDLSFPSRFIEGSAPKNGSTTKGSQFNSIEVWCVFEAFNRTTVTWKKEDPHEVAPSIRNATAVPGYPKRVNSSYAVQTQRPEDNGTYICEIEKGVSGKVDVRVFAPPKVVIHVAKGISTTQIYFKWTVYTYNSDLERYDLLTLSDAGYILNNDTPKPSNTSFVVGGLKKSTNYTMKLRPITTFNKDNNTLATDGMIFAQTLDFDPVFVPKISINGFSATSVTIGWKGPPDRDAPYIHYYILEAKMKDQNISRTAYHSRDDNNLPYMFDNLEPHSTYIFTVCAGNEYTNKCGAKSEEMEAATSDGTPSAPTDVKSTCTSTIMNLTWGRPDKPNAEIKGYTMELTGNATFKDRYGKQKASTWGPLSKFTTNESVIARFTDLQPNTHYTVRLSAMTRTRRRGAEATSHCKTLPAPPDHPPRPRWRKVLQGDKYMFKMYLPRITERNGRLCCYRVYMVRLLSHSEWKNLPPPNDIQVLEHKDVHAQPPVLGAYITDIFSNDNFPFESELLMGDLKSHFNKSETTFNNTLCNCCLTKPNRFEPTTTTTTTTTTQPTTTDDSFTTDDPDIDLPKDSSEERSRRSYKDFNHLSIMRDTADASQHISEKEMVVPFDGQLDSGANYTLFVELISEIEGEPPMFSGYVNVLMPAPTPPIVQPTSSLEIALQVICAVAALVLLLMILFCIRQTRRSRKMPAHAHEMNSLPNRFWRFFPRRTPQIPVMPSDVPPIPKDELAAAYAERQADSDYLFQKEFELLQILPECYSDRTTHASEARENQPKNRYPDIKAYDQTRVKLSQIDGIAGSDYINANYVMGYQDRKQFICAQGPTDTTVNDFWRMIWEQGLELVVMLTNLEEYSKVKCSKYWPDEVRGSKAFGGLTVHHVSERRYSDYIVRELQITKQPVNSDGQPIIEGNGIAKRNGDCKDASEGSVPTSPREVKEPETRIVKHYHFLMWKDFAAPEHAYSILKFIKRVNEAWSGMLGRACVVHCSAGVGRTGTLVALDCLLEQLRDVGHAAVFNTVAELRRSRNFLVQSLKQYVFVYRALVEYAHYEDTEIPAHRLKACVDLLRSTPQQTSSCLMEIEFEKILNCPIPEPIKSCAAGGAEELRPKNRCLDILPYDRNRVILAPIPGRDFSTYINASFLEAYDNTEGFIITQDPMPSTIMDFWRMVSEHNVTTIVMLSELGDNKCPRYWDDGTAQYEHISVQYEESESCPYYTRRQFRVVNNKSGCSTCVRQLQYQGWPTAAGHVPEVTRGLAELADAAAPRAAPAMLVHCHLGTERSALFVALCVLICQLRTERRVDVCCVARKVRSQRVKTINTFLQYEFLHRAILNYAELHNLLEDS